MANIIEANQTFQSGIHMYEQIFQKERDALERKKWEISEEKEKAEEQLKLEREKFAGEVREAKLELQKERENLEREKRELEKFKEKFEFLSNESKKIKLNVGGTLFTTTIQTLSKERSMFSAMFGGLFSVESDENDEYFIDRDPQYFKTILNYLRKGTISWSKFSDVELEELYEEIEFYQVNFFI
jgi:hypothetical protein